MIYFVHLPRTGGTFISQYARTKHTRLSKQFNYWPPGYKRGTKRHLPAKTIPDYKYHYLFGFIRNPFDWYVSQYSYFIDKERKGITETEKGISGFTDAGLVGEEFRVRFPNINKWIKYGLKSRGKFWLSDVYDYMFCDNGELILNYVGKFEKMNEEFNHVLKVNNLSPRLPLSKYQGYKNESVREDYHKYYNRKSIEIINEKDKDILKLYGYKY